MNYANNFECSSLFHLPSFSLFNQRHFCPLSFSPSTPVRQIEVPAKSTEKAFLSSPPLFFLSASASFLSSLSPENENNESLHLRSSLLSDQHRWGRAVAAPSKTHSSIRDGKFVSLTCFNELKPNDSPAEAEKLPWALTLSVWVCCP